MELRSYILEIPEARELGDGCAAIAHGTQYGIVLRNRSDRKCDVEVRVDGESVGVWRLDKVSSIRIERPTHDTGCFTFFALGSPEARQAALERSDSLGLVSAEFRPEGELEPSDQQNTDSDAVGFAALQLRLIAENPPVEPVHPTPDHGAQATMPPPLPPPGPARPENQHPLPPPAEKRPRGGLDPLFSKIFIFPVLFFVLAIATHGLAVSSSALVRTHNYALALGGIVFSAVILLLGYAILLAYRHCDRLRKRQLRHEYFGAFGANLRPTKNVVAFFLFCACVIGIMAGIILPPLQGGFRGGLVAPPEWALTLIIGATFFAFGLDRMQQRAEVRRFA